MAITSNSIDIKGVAVEPIIEEVLFQNNTLNKGLVTFEDDVKGYVFGKMNTFFTFRPSVGFHNIFVPKHFNRCTGILPCYLPFRMLYLIQRNITPYSFLSF